MDVTSSLRSLLPYGRRSIGINQLIDNAEDPALMMDQMIRDYTKNISEAEDAVAVRSEDNERLRQGAHRMGLPAEHVHIDIR